MKTNEIFLGTILLEPNRWPDKAESTYSRLQKLSPFKQGTPQILASQWMERVVADGFDGIELWANHALLCSDHGFSGSFTIEFTTGIEWGQPSPPVETLYQNALNEMRMLKEACSKVY